MACQHVHSHGWKNQKDIQHCGCNSCYCMASQGIWATRFLMGCKYKKNQFSITTNLIKIKIINRKESLVHYLQPLE
jgi:hypothetical protein